MARKTGLFDMGFREFNTPDAQVAVTGIERPRTIFWSPTILFVRFHCNTAVDWATFRRAFVDRLGFQ